MEPRIFYLCNGQNSHCNHCAGCFLQNGECHHTANLEFSNTEFCADPWNHPERFDPVPSGTYMAYFEKERTNDSNGK